MSFKVKDHYFNKAKKENYLARSAYKLEEIQQKFKVLKKGDLVFDLGYHPGSWIQYTQKVIGDKGQIVGIDIKEVNSAVQALENVEVFQKDVMDIQSLEELGVDRKFDVLVSDMAPNTTGIKSVDQDRSLALIEMIFYLLPKFLLPGGNLVFKIFDSHQAQEFIKEKRNDFDSLKKLKPKSTRSVSKEFFVIGQGFRHNS